ncbi:MAG: aspartate kinase [Cytophagaceae bacterium]|nr:aspartate kinase [Cytophagaceae bacterium]MDW8456534.1 aspartate kinase [Cytophagaceae bacterium]
MKVLKFGGTSVGKPERMHSVSRIISEGKKNVVVLSAVSGTTNSLVAISEKALSGDKGEALKLTENLFVPFYYEFSDALLSTSEGKRKGKAIIDRHYSFVKQTIESANPFTERENKLLLAEGELISTELFQTYLQEQNFKSVLLPALDFMRIDENDEPDIAFIEQKLIPLLKQYESYDLYITQGYICRNAAGDVDNLKRGGSDYTATLIGAAIRAEEIQIWTDIDGMHNNDPRVVKKTFPIPELSFDEAAELAYFGAKILHPTCIRPAHERNIPVRLLNTMQPEQKGTVITHKPSERSVTAIAAKDNIIAIKIKSARMLLAYGFLRKIFEIFEKYKTPVDMITTSEVAVSLTIDDSKNLDAIVSELREFSSVEVDKNQTIICIVGSFDQDKNTAGKKAFSALENIPIRMISYGGSNHNISILISSEYKHDALNALNECLFSDVLVNI